MIYRNIFKVVKGHGGRVGGMMNFGGWHFIHREIDKYNISTNEKVLFFGLLLLLLLFYYKSSSYRLIKMSSDFYSMLMCIMFWKKKLFIMFLDYIWCEHNLILDIKWIQHVAY